MRRAYLPTALLPHDGVVLERVGPHTDGGYMVSQAAMSHTRQLLSMGLGNDWRFESEFQSRSGASVTVLDHTVNSRFWLAHELRRLTNVLGVASEASAATFNRTASYRRYRRFFADPSRVHLRQPVGYGNEGTVSVPDLLCNRDPGQTFVKMDIEGHEWRVLPDLLASEDRLSGLVVEFHEVDLHLPRLIEFVSALRDLVIVDASVNNFGLIAPDGTPSLVELSFAPRSATGATNEEWAYIPIVNVPNKPPAMLGFR